MYKKLPWLIVATIAATLWLPNLLAKGMFLDGVAGAVSALEFSHGHGGPWVLHSIQYTVPESWGVFPMAIWLLAAYYQMFGDSFIVERIYSLTCALLQLQLTATLWRTIFLRDEKIRELAWWPCLLWLCSPLTSWTYSSNLLECTMCIFTTASIIVAVRFVETQKQLFLSSIAVGALMLLAFITKGPVALFPFALPILFIAMNERFDIKLAFLFSTLITVSFIGCFTLLFSYAAPQNFLRHYLEVQLLPALQHKLNEEAAPFQIVIELLKAISPFLVATVFLLVLKLKPVNKSWWRWILLGMAGSLPIALSAKQRKFYLIPALTPFAIGFALLLLPLLQLAVRKAHGAMKQHLQRFITVTCSLVLLLCLSLCIMNCGVAIRDEILLADLANMQHWASEEKVIRADVEVCSNWLLRCYLLRLYKQKLCLPYEKAPTHFFMTLPSMRSDQLPPTAQKVFAGKNLDLYKLQP